MAGCSKAHTDKVKVHFTVSLIILVSKTKLQTGDGSFWNQLIDAELQAAPHPTPPQNFASEQQSANNTEANDRDETELLKLIVYKNRAT